MSGISFASSLFRFATTPTQAANVFSTGSTADPAGNYSLNAFNDLVLAYQDAAYNFACYLVDDPDLAADITQKAFINAYLNFESFHGPSFKSWLFKIIKNASVDEFRSASYRRNRSLDEMENEEDWHRFPVEEQSPEKHMEQAEQESAIHTALSRLDEPFRAVIILVDIQEMDYEEAAQVLRVPVGTVKSRLARARMKFRVEMEKTTFL